MELYLDKGDVDRFIAMHLYGCIKEVGRDLSQDEITLLERSNMADLSTTFSRWRAVEKSVVEKVQKLSPCETYVALLKGYVSLSLLTMPRAFANGGYIFSPICEFCSAVVTTYCVTKLVSVGLKYGSYSYSGVVQKAFGPRVRRVLDFMIAAT